MKNWQNLASTIRVKMARRKLCLDCDKKKKKKEKKLDKQHSQCRGKLNYPGESMRNFKVETIATCIAEINYNKNKAKVEVINWSSPGTR